jgi:hypothetical protein
MNKLLSQLKITGIGLIAYACSASFMLPPALGQPIAPTIAAVQVENKIGATSTFLSSDPAGVGYNFTYALKPGSTKAKGPYVGVNLPSLTYGNLTNEIGSFSKFSFLYEVLNAGPKADAGLTYYVQTSDGFLHTAKSTSYLTGGKPLNGVNVYQVTVLANQFSPAITTQVATTLNVRYSHCAAGTIYFTPDVSIAGSNFSLDIGAANTMNDTAFNN